MTRRSPSSVTAEEYRAAYAFVAPCRLCALPGVYCLAATVPGHYADAQAGDR